MLSAKIPSTNSYKVLQHWMTTPSLKDYWMSLESSGSGEEILVYIILAEVLLIIAYGRHHISMKNWQSFWTNSTRTWKKVGSKFPLPVYCTQKSLELTYVIPYFKPANSARTVIVLTRRLRMGRSPSQSWALLRIQSLSVKNQNSVNTSIWCQMSRI